MENKELIIVGDLSGDVNKVPPDSQATNIRLFISFNSPTRYY